MGEREMRREAPRQNYTAMTRLKFVLRRTATFQDDAHTHLALGATLSVYRRGVRVTVLDAGVEAQVWLKLRHVIRGSLFIF